MKPITFETLIADQKFKIEKSDEAITEFIKDCQRCFFDVDGRSSNNRS